MCRVVLCSVRCAGRSASPRSSARQEPGAPPIDELLDMARTRAAGSSATRRSPRPAVDRRAAAAAASRPPPAQRHAGAPAGGRRAAHRHRRRRHGRPQRRLQAAEGRPARDDLRRLRPDRRPHVHRDRPARRRPHDRARRRVHRQHARRDAGADERVRPRAPRHAGARSGVAQAGNLLHQRPPLHAGAGRARRSCRWRSRSSRTTTRWARSSTTRPRAAARRSTGSRSRSTSTASAPPAGCASCSTSPTSPSTASTSANSRRSTSSSSSAPATSSDREAFALLGESDERYKVRGGNQRIVDELAKRRRAADPAAPSARSDPEQGPGLHADVPDATAESVDEDADMVVLAIPFTLLREVKMQVELPAVKKKAIAGARLRRQRQGAGRLPEPAVAEAGLQRRHLHRRGVPARLGQQLPADGAVGGLTLYSGGKAALAVGEGTAEAVAARLMTRHRARVSGRDPRRATARCRGSTGRPSRGRRAATPATSRASGRRSPAPKALPVGNLFFAGEHCSYDFQGYMNGAAQSGADTAKAVMAEG